MKCNLQSVPVISEKSDIRTREYRFRKEIVMYSVLFEYRYTKSKCDSRQTKMSQQVHCGSQRLSVGSHSTTTDNQVMQSRCTTIGMSHSFFEAFQTASERERERKSEYGATRVRRNIKQHTKSVFNVFEFEVVRTDAGLFEGYTTIFVKCVCVHSSIEE